MNDLNYNPVLAASQKQAAGPAVSMHARRIIGPIPPRDKTGRLCLKPVIGRRVKVDEFGETVLDENGRAVMETGDTRDRREYAAYEVGQEPAPEALKGLKLFRVDLVPEPFALVYARGKDDAVEVYKREFGITRFGEYDPQVTEVSA